MEEAVKTLVEMGFSREKSLDALSKVTPSTADAALDYLVNHENENANDDDDKQAQDDAENQGESNTPAVVRSYKCTDTGKLFRTMQDAQLYAERTGHSNFEESDIEVPPLTAEEKAAKILQIRELLKKKKAEREANEAAEARKAEIERRKGGQSMAEIKEQHEKIQREAEYAARKKEKELFKKEKERLRLEVAKDKAERASEAALRKGCTPIEAKKAYDDAYARALGKDDSKTSQTRDNVNSIDVAIKDLLSYRAGGDGIRALATIKKMLGNILKNPSEGKFRSINLQNEAFKKRVASLIGGVALFKASGFTKEETANQLLLDEASLDLDLIGSVVDKITQAIEANE